MLAAREYQRTSSHTRADLYETVQIPVRQEYVTLTGSYELSVLLNQIVFSRKEELTIDDIKHLSLCDSTKQTLRKKLDRLVDEGFISKRRYGMYGRYLYKASNDVYTEDNSILALIEGLDLRNHPCYLTASILNKFRQFALSNIESIRISANELRQLLQSEKSVSLVRLILRRLVAQGYLSEHSVGGVYEYSINTQKLTNIFDPEETERQALELTELFGKYAKYIGLDALPKQAASWKLSFKRMLANGYNYGTIRHIIAYVAQNDYERLITTPSRLKQHYERLKESSYEKLSRRKASRFLYKLIGGFINVRARTEFEEVTLQESNVALVMDDAAIWQQAYEYVQTHMNMIKKWFFKQSAGVSDIELDDYLNEAVMVTYNRFKKPDDKSDASSICYRLSDFMYRHRHVDKSVKRGGSSEVSNIVQFYNGDVSEILERVETEIDDIKVCEGDRSAELYKLLSRLDPRTAEIIKAYHGLDGRMYTFEEIAVKIGLKSAGYVTTLYYKGMKQLKSMAPPD